VDIINLWVVIIAKDNYSYPMNLGIIMDPIDRINIKKDSSFAMLLAAKRAAGICLHGAV